MMKIAITGGTGFVGRHLTRSLVGSGHSVVVIPRGGDHRDAQISQPGDVTFAAAGIDDEERLVQAFVGCDAVAHCAGINRETGSYTYQLVHVEGTRNVVNAAKQAGVKKILMLSFLRARPHCGSLYHESKWAAEEIVRASGLDYTVVKAGVIFGKSDRKLDGLSHALHSLPLSAAVGIRESTIRPIAAEDLIRIIQASLMEGRLSRQTVAAIGPEEMRYSEAERRAARLAGKRIYVVRLPVSLYYLIAWCFERFMAIPLISSSQVRMLAEGISEPQFAGEQLPHDLAPKSFLGSLQLRRGDKFWSFVG